MWTFLWVDGMEPIVLLVKVAQIGVNLKNKH